MTEIQSTTSDRIFFRNSETTVLFRNCGDNDHTRTGILMERRRSGTAKGRQELACFANPDSFSDSSHEF